MSGKYLIIVSSFTKEISQRLLDGALKNFGGREVPRERIDIEWVPGCFEIPTVAAKAARSRAYVGIVCLGCVIRGETSHFDFVAHAAAEGILRVGVECELPVIFGVLTTEDFDQAMARSGGDKCDKGSESVDAAFDTLTVLKRIGGKNHLTI